MLLQDRTLENLLTGTWSKHAADNSKLTVAAGPSIEESSSTQMQGQWKIQHLCQFSFISVEPFHSSSYLQVPGCLTYIMLPQHVVQRPFRTDEPVKHRRTKMATLEADVKPFTPTSLKFLTVGWFNIRAGSYPNTRVPSLLIPNWAF